MQILVLYYSKGGNTKKLAEAIAGGVESVEGAGALVKSTHEVTREDFLNAAGIIAGSPVYFGGMAAGLKKVFDDLVGIRRKMEGKVGAAFATSGDPSGGKETTMISIIQCLLIYGMVIAGDPMSATTALPVQASRMQKRWKTGPGSGPGLHGSPGKWPTSKCGGILPDNT